MQPDSSNDSQKTKQQKKLTFDLKTQQNKPYEAYEDLSFLSKNYSPHLFFMIDSQKSSTVLLDKSDDDLTQLGFLIFRVPEDGKFQKLFKEVDKKINEAPRQILSLQFCIKDTDYIRHLQNINQQKYQKYKPRIIYYGQTDYISDQQDIKIKFSGHFDNSDYYDFYFDNHCDKKVQNQFWNLNSQPNFISVNDQGGYLNTQSLNIQFLINSVENRQQNKQGVLTFNQQKFIQAFDYYRSKFLKQQSENYMSNIYNEYPTDENILSWYISEKSLYNFLTRIFLITQNPMQLIYVRPAVSGLYNMIKKLNKGLFTRNQNQITLYRGTCLSQQQFELVKQCKQKKTKILSVFQMSSSLDKKIAKSFQKNAFITFIFPMDKIKEGEGVAEITSNPKQKEWLINYLSLFSVNSAQKVGDIYNIQLDYEGSNRKKQGKDEEWYKKYAEVNNLSDLFFRTGQFKLASRYFEQLLKNLTRNNPQQNKIYTLYQIKNVQALLPTLANESAELQQSIIAKINTIQEQWKKTRFQKDNYIIAKKKYLIANFGLLCKQKNIKSKNEQRNRFVESIQIENYLSLALKQSKAAECIKLSLKIYKKQSQYSLFNDNKKEAMIIIEQALKFVQPYKEQKQQLKQIIEVLEFTKMCYSVDQMTSKQSSNFTKILKSTIKKLQIIEGKDFNYVICRLFFSYFMRKKQIQTKNPQNSIYSSVRTEVSTTPSFDSHKKNSLSNQKYYEYCFQNSFKTFEKIKNNLTEEQKAFFYEYEAKMYILLNRLQIAETAKQKLEKSSQIYRNLKNQNKVKYLQGLIQNLQNIIKKQNKQEKNIAQQYKKRLINLKHLGTEYLKQSKAFNDNSIVNQIKSLSQLLDSIQQKLQSKQRNTEQINLPEILQNQQSEKQILRDFTKVLKIREGVEQNISQNFDNSYKNAQIMHQQQAQQSSQNFDKTVNTNKTKDTSSSR